MTDIQAAIGIIQLSKLSSFRALRSLQVSKYNSILSNCMFQLEHKHPETSAFNLYIIRLPDEVCRDEVFKMLNNIGIGAYYHYPLLHHSALYPNNEVLRVAEQYQQTALTLPLGPHLTEDDVVYISNQLIDILKNSVM